MRRNSASLRHSGTYTSPGTPEYGDNSDGGTPKRWTSERVPLHTYSSRRHISSSALMPFYSGRALPSKWDDAERWITSPVSGYGVCKNAVAQPQKQPKSKSGPLGTPGHMYLPNYSPPVPALEGGSEGSFVAGTQFTTGVLLPHGLSVQCGAGIRAKANSLYPENCMDRPNKVRQLSDLLTESSRPSSEDGKLDGAKEAGTMVSRVVSRRDMATQMSPDGSTNSSPVCSTYPSLTPSATKQQQIKSVKVEVRDVQVDKGIAVSKQFKKRGLQKAKRGLPDVQNSDPPWDLAQGANNTSKIQREEARIAAWENLQKAKAEAAIQKLEMKLEKKRSESMDKILNKLHVAQIKAQEMRSTTAECHAPDKAASFSKCVKMSSFSACFFCHKRWIPA